MYKFSILPQNPHLQFLHEEGMTRLLLNETLLRNYTTLVHIKNTQHASEIPDEKQRRFFTEPLNLTMEEAEFMGKVHRILREYTDCINR